VSKRAAAVVASNPEFHRLAKKAFQSYLRSVYLMPNREVFNVSELNYDAYAISLGLADTPSTKFLKNVSNRDNIRKEKNTSRKLQHLKEKIKLEKLQKRVADGVVCKTLQKKHVNVETDSEDSDDGLVVKTRHNFEESSEKLPEYDINRATTRPKKKIRTEASGNRIVFDDEGNEVHAASRTIDENDYNINDLAGANEQYMDRIRTRLASTKALDDEEAKVRVKDKHRKLKQKRKMADSDSEDDEVSNSNNSESGSSSDDENSISSVEGRDMKAQEDLALQLLRNK